MADEKAQEGAGVDAVAESTAVANAAGPAAAGNRGGISAHFRKWWWLHVIVLIVVVLVIVLPVVYVAYPHIAQSDVNKSSLNVTNLVFSDPTPDSIHVNQTQILTNHASYHPTIYGFNATIALVGATAPIATGVPIPRVQANNGAVIDVDTTLALNDSSGAVTEFAQAVLGLESFELNIYGRPGLKEGSLPTKTVTFNKTVTMKGLDGLKGFALQDVMIDLNTTGTNMNGSVFIPNPSVITIAMGNVTFDVSVNGTQIGQSYLSNVVLTPGNNTIPLVSTINQTDVIELISGDSAAYPSGVIPLTILGNSSVYDGQEIPYFSQALQSNPLQTTLNVTQVLIDSGLGSLATAL